MTLKFSKQLEERRRRRLWVWIDRKTQHGAKERTNPPFLSVSLMFMSVFMITKTKTSEKDRWNGCLLLPPIQSLDRDIAFGLDFSWKPS